MALDADDLKKITDLIKTGLTDFGGELDKKFVTGDAAQKMVTQGVKGVLDGEGGVSTTLKGITDAIAELKKGGGEDKDKDKKKKGDEVDPAVARLQEQLNALEKKNRASEEAREAAEARSRGSVLDNQIRAALTAVGIPAERHDLVIPVLKTQTAADGKPVLRFGDDGQPVYVAQRKGFTDSLSVAEGLKEWGATDMAKVYLPPAGQGGTGGDAGGQSNTRVSTAPKDKDGNIDWGAIGSQVSLAPSLTTES